MNRTHDITAWARGMVLALMLSSLRQSATAQVVIVMLSQPINYGPVSLTENIDITGSGNADFILNSDGSGGSFLAAQGNNKLIVLPQTADLDNGSTVAALNAGDVIGPELSSLNPAFQWRDAADEPTGSSTLADQNTAGQIGNFYGKTAFIGFDLVQGTQNYYGWMEVQNPLDFAAGSIVAWGYSTTPDAGIFAGGFSVPEPPVYLITMLTSFASVFLGKCYVIARRSRF